MKSNIKRIIIDIFGVLVIASVIGLLYNTFQENGISLIREPEKYIYSDETDIFNETNKIDSAKYIISNKNDSLKTDKIANQDTIKATIKSDSLVNKNKNEQLKNIKKDLSSEIIDKSGYKNVNIDFVKKHLSDKRVTIIDARTPIDFNKGHIENAINIDPQQEDQNSLFNTIMSLPDDKIYIIYCTGGQCDLSHHLYDAMKSFGFMKLYIFPGGWEEWSK